MKESTKVLLGILGGLAAGTVIGMLFAPDHGENTRKKVSDQSGKIKEDLSSRLQQSVDRMNTLTESAFNLINDYKSKLKKEEGKESAPTNSNTAF